MPSHEIHRKIDKLILGKEFREVHKILDEPVKWLGKRHRISRHDLAFAFMRFGASEEFASACLHILTDFGVSKMRRKRYESKRRNRKGVKRSARRQA